MCGQVFRWRELPDGRLLGADGDNWWLVTFADDAYVAEGNGDSAAWGRYFRSDEDWPAHGSAVRRLAPELAPYMDTLPGLRLLRPGDAVEETFSFLCTSNNHLGRISGMVGALAAYGPTLASVEGYEVHRFPTVERISEIPESELRQKGFGYRAATIPVAARQIVERGGKAWLDGLKETDYPQARLELLQLSGVGPKLADCICLFALDHTEAVPVDTHVWQAATRLYFPELAGTSLTEKRYRQVGDHFRDKLGDLAGWAHQFLFYENLLNWRRR